MQQLQGLNINHLTVLSLDTSKIPKAGKHKYWWCKCNLCGNIKSIRSSELKQGKFMDCGCQRQQRLSKGATIDLNGKTFGYLTVLHRDETRGYHSGNHAYWMCKCALCGNIESVQSQMLLHHGKDRYRKCCGFTLGERKIIELLDSHNISYIHDKTYKKCIYDKTGRPLRFDFRINQHSDCDYIIEFDGAQHFKPVPIWDNTESFQSRKRRDAYKNIWCHNNGVNIIRIPYTHLKHLCIDDLRVETTRFLVPHTKKSLSDL